MKSLIAPMRLVIIVGTDLDENKMQSHIMHKRCQMFRACPTAHRRNTDDSPIDLD